VSYYLGIDGGGTKTTCAVGDESNLLATATTGPSNIVRVGESQTRESLQHSVRQACAAAGITPEQVVHTCVGGSGAARLELAAMVRGFLAEILATPIDVVGDHQTSLEAAFETGPGIIVIAGTGSAAYGRNVQGQTARAGGWGFAIGDEGSAHWIGRSAVIAVLRASDLPPEPGGKNHPFKWRSHDLAEPLMKEWGVNSLIDLARIANSVPPPDFASLFPVVVDSIDDHALDILKAAGRELARIASLVSLGLFHETQPVPVAMIGGVFRYSKLVREVFYNELRQFDARAEVREQVVDPVEGALRLARKAAAESNQQK
jgi:glucosamine kinase